VEKQKPTIVDVNSLTSETGINIWDESGDNYDNLPILVDDPLVDEDEESETFSQSE
jgi:hypothetical protein